MSRLGPVLWQISYNVLCAEQGYFYLKGVYIIWSWGFTCPVGRYYAASRVYTLKVDRYGDREYKLFCECVCMYTSKEQSYYDKLVSPVVFRRLKFWLVSKQYPPFKTMHCFVFVVEETSWPCPRPSISGIKDRSIAWFKNS